MSVLRSGCADFDWCDDDAVIVKEQSALAVDTTRMAQESFALTTSRGLESWLGRSGVRWPSPPTKRASCSSLG